MEKACKKCKEVKPLEEFTKDSRNKDGRTGKCVQCSKTYTAEYRANNKDKLNANNKAYHAANREILNTKKKMYREANKESIKVKYKDWAIVNKDKKNASNAKYRAAKLNAIPSWFGELDELVLSEAYELAQHREELTGVKWHVDHIVPLQGKLVSGIHCASNIQVITASENLEKSNKWNI